jgi:2-polyprenyl-6-methoxyphenol hydroxylase-like FAD-dependent oxidoreductase
MTQDFQVVIVGGGPTGVACSIYLAIAGIRSAIIERPSSEARRNGDGIFAEAELIHASDVDEVQLIQRRHDRAAFSEGSERMRSN